MTDERVEELIASMASSLEGIDQSLRLATQMCFCGHNLQSHAPTCVHRDCQVKCKEFNPPVLAISRGMNQMAIQMIDLKLIIAHGMGQAIADPSPIIKPS
jgi:hypothetical protein